MQSHPRKTDIKCWQIRAHHTHHKQIDQNALQKKRFHPVLTALIFRTDHHSLGQFYVRYFIHVLFSSKHYPASPPVPDHPCIPYKDMSLKTDSSFSDTAAAVPQPLQKGDVGGCYLLSQLGLSASKVGRESGWNWIVLRWTERWGSVPSYKVASTSPKRNRERLFSLFHCIWRGIVRPGRQRVAMQIERSLDKKWYQL